MRILPENPNLDHLRQQARDLLLSLREANPSASLADAQRTLARQFGFDSWTALRDEVRRVRAERSRVDAPSLQAVAAAFDLGEVTAGEFLASEVMGPEYRVETRTGCWYVHGVLPWVDTSHAEEAVRLMSAARHAGVPAVVPKRTRAGELLAMVGDRCWRVDEWMPMGPPIATPLATDAAHRLGTLLGRLHALALRPALPMNPWLARRRRVQHWVERSRAARVAGAAWSDQLDDAIPALERLTALADAEPDTSSLLLSHTNLVASNVRRGARGDLVPRAWEFAGAIPAAWEVGLVLHAWTDTPTGVRTAGMVRPFIDAYTAVAGARPQIERSMFAPAITAWLQWLASRIDYALDGDGDAMSRATRELTAMLRAPLTPESFEMITEAAVG